MIVKKCKNVYHRNKESVWTRFFVKWIFICPLSDGKGKRGGKDSQGDYKAAGNDPGAGKKAIPAGVSFPPSEKYSGAGISAQKTSGANPG